MKWLPILGLGRLLRITGAHLQVSMELRELRVALIAMPAEFFRRLRRFFRQTNAVPIGIL